MLVSFSWRVYADTQGSTCGRLKSGGVHDSYTFQCGRVGSFTSPGIVCGIDTRWSQVVSLQTAHSWANGGVLLGDACMGSGVAFEAIKLSTGMKLVREKLKLINLIVNHA